MKWLKNLEAVASAKKSGECPYCHSENTDYGFVVDDEKTKMGHGAIWCNDCHNGYHISRVKVSAGMKLTNIPENVKY